MAQRTEWEGIWDKNSEGRWKCTIWSKVCRPLLPKGLSGKESTCQCRRPKRHRFDPWVEKTPWRKKRQLTPIFLPGKSHGRRSLAGYSLWGHKVTDTTERLNKHNWATEQTQQQLQTMHVSITWELISNTNSQAAPQTNCISGIRPGICDLTSSLGDSYPHFKYQCREQSCFPDISPWEGAEIYPYEIELRKVQEEPTRQIIVWLDTWTQKSLW